MANMKYTAIYRPNLKKMPEYRSYMAMRDRCYRPTYPNFQRWGGRGIKVCDRWRGQWGFDYFLEDMGPRPEGTTLDRIDNDGDYTPENCRWATRKEQARHSVKLITYKGKQWQMAELAEHLGIKYETLKWRIANGKPESSWGDPVFSEKSVDIEDFGE